MNLAQCRNVSELFPWQLAPAMMASAAEFVAHNVSDALVRCQSCAILMTNDGQYARAIRMHYASNYQGDVVSTCASQRPQKPLRYGTIRSTGVGWYLKLTSFCLQLRQEQRPCLGVCKDEGAAVGMRSGQQRCTFVPML